MQRKLRTATGKALYAVRKHIVEPVFGMIKSCAGNPQVSVARPGESVGRVATDMLDPQSFEDLAPLLQRRGRLRGIVRAHGWAEAEKAKAQRNPAAMPEHEQIFGQAPSQAFTEISFPFRRADGKHVSAGFMILMPGSFSLHPPHPGSES